MRITSEIECRGAYDIIVAGGGVAGVAAALTARGRGLRVLLMEKSNILGGLATLGQVNYFVPMCNGRGTQIIFGLCHEWFYASAQYGFDTIPPEWQKNADHQGAVRRMQSHYSPYIFALQLTEMVHKAGVDLLFDCVASQPVMEGNLCKGVIAESKSGREFYAAKVVIDTTGDADLLRRCGMPIVAGTNYYTYIGKKITLDSCREAWEKGDIRYAYKGVSGGAINLYGHHQPADKPLWSGLTVEEVSEYLIDQQLTMLNSLKADDRRSRDIAMLPLMPNFRTTCHIQGDYTLREEDAYRHFPDSVCAINDFDRLDYLYEVPLRCLTRADYPNLLTAGRSASAEGYAWDILRVIPPAILTGQAAAEAAVLSIEEGVGVSNVTLSVLQERIASDNILVHFPDALVPATHTPAEYGPDEGHL